MQPIDPARAPGHRARGHTRLPSGDRSLRTRMRVLQVLERFDSRSCRVRSPHCFGGSRAARLDCPDDPTVLGPPSNPKAWGNNRTRREVPEVVLPHVLGHPFEEAVAALAKYQCVEVLVPPVPIGRPIPFRYAVTSGSMTTF